jgi:hypothetical protein
MRKLTAVHTTGLAVCTLIAAACTGVIGNPPGQNGSAGPGGATAAAGGPNNDTTGATSGSGTPSASGVSGSATATSEDGAAGTPTIVDTLFGSTASDTTAAGTMVLRHLEQFEYINTVTSLFGAAAVASAGINTTNVPAEPPVPNTSSGFPLPGLVDVTTATAYQADAEALATAVLPNVSTLLSCTPGTGAADASTSDLACANTFITTFGQQMYRRPLNATEISGLVGLYQTGVSTLGLDFNGAIDLLIEEMLQSPGFLYHWEVGPGATVYSGTEVQLDGYALANRLSYFLWGSMPDATLFAAAAAGQLSTQAQVTAQATRMLASTQARSAVANFFEQWLGMTQLAAQPKDATTYPSWNTTLASEMDTEFQNFITSVIFDRTGELNELYTSSTTSIDGDLATLYGATGVSGTTFQSTTLPAAQRSGLLTTAAWLTLNGDPAGSNPVYRGHSLYTQMLCGIIPAPPPNVPPPAAASAGGTTRQRFQMHDQQACAVGCHSLMDPYGYTFENYDGLGEWRTTDNSLPVDASIAIALDGKSVTVANAVAMTPLLAQSPTAQECFTAQWLTYGLGRTVTSDDAASAQAAQTAFESANFKVTTLLSSLASSRTFRYRTPSAGEVLQ